MDKHPSEINKIHVAIIPPKSVETNLIKQVAAIVNKDLYEIRLLLAGNIPKIITHFDDTIAAEKTVISLRSIGIKAYHFVDKDIRRLQTTANEFTAHEVLFDDSYVQFLSRGGAVKNFKAKDAFLIIFGRVHLSVMTKQLQTKMKLSIPASLITGGIPIWRRSEIITEGKSAQNEFFIWLYKQSSQEPEVQIYESDFNFSFLGDKITPYTSKNVELLIDELKKNFPEAVYDDRLTKNKPVVERNEIPDVCKLLDLYYLAELNKN